MQVRLFLFGLALLTVGLFSVTPVTAQTKEKVKPVYGTEFYDQLK